MHKYTSKLEFTGENGYMRSFLPSVRSQFAIMAADCWPRM